jgi:hypothetical protein
MNRPLHLVAVFDKVFAAMAAAVIGGDFVLSAALPDDIVAMEAEEAKEEVPHFHDLLPINSWTACDA